MISAIIFDFDGVLIESVDIKTEAFRELFKNYPKHIDNIVQYHIHHGGVSRVEKIKYFYREVLKRPLEEDVLQRFCLRFSELVVEKVVAAPWVSGAKELLDMNFKKQDMFIVSGTPDEEIQTIVERRKIAHYFKAIFGSPAKKSELVKYILEEYGYLSSQVLFIGDAITDLKGAKANDIKFIARVVDDAVSWIYDEAVLARVKDLVEVKSILENM